MDANNNSKNSGNLFDTSAQYPGKQNSLNIEEFYDKSGYCISLSKSIIIILTKYRY